MPPRNSGASADDRGPDAQSAHTGDLEGEARSKAESVALRFLTYRPRTAQEMRRRLERGEFPEEVIEDVLAWLGRIGYVDDARFAEDWVRTRAHGKMFGPYRLRRELMQKGVAEEFIDRALEALDDASVYANALRAAEKRASVLVGVEPDRARRRLGDYLRRRGYSGETIRRVLSQTLARRGHQPSG